MPRTEPTESPAPPATPAVLHQRSGTARWPAERLRRDVHPAQARLDLGPPRQRPARIEVGSPSCPPACCREWPMWPRSCATRPLPGWTVMALVPNLRGALAALEAGVHQPDRPVSASEAHSLANVRRSRIDMVAVVREIVALRDATAPGVPVEIDAGVRLHAPGRDPRGRGGLAGRAAGRRRGRRDRPVGHHRHGQSGAGAAAVRSTGRHWRQDRLGAPATTRAGSGWRTAWRRWDVGVRGPSIPRSADWVAAPTRPARPAMS